MRRVNVSRAKRWELWPKIIDNDVQHRACTGRRPRICHSRRCARWTWWRGRGPRGRWRIWRAGGRGRTGRVAHKHTLSAVAWILSQLRDAAFQPTAPTRQRACFTVPRARRRVVNPGDALLLGLARRGAGRFIQIAWPIIRDRRAKKVCPLSPTGAHSSGAIRVGGWRAPMRGRSPPSAAADQVKHYEAREQVVHHGETRGWGSCSRPACPWGRRRRVRARCARRGRARSSRVSWSTAQHRACRQVASCA